jgi:hypothetical protein
MASRRTALVMRTERASLVMSQLLDIVRLTFKRCSISLAASRNAGAPRRPHLPGKLLPILEELARGARVFEGGQPDRRFRAFLD